MKSTKRCVYVCERKRERERPVNFVFVLKYVVVWKADNRGLKETQKRKKMPDTRLLIVGNFLAYSVYLNIFL